MSAKRAMDVGLGGLCLALAAPLIGAGVLGVRLSSPGPVFYRARRAGRDGRPFEMLKLRSMHVAGGGAAITGPGDSRVFPFGRLIRALKIDELPQFVNVLRGEMSLVGPRPEDPEIVARHYTGWMRETLEVAPGITSPGAIFYYGVGEALLDPADPEGSYVARVLAPKLAVERAYLDRATPLSDLGIMALTVAAVIGRALGVVVRTPAADRRAAEAWVPGESFPDAAPAAAR